MRTGHFNSPQMLDDKPPDSESKRRNQSKRCGGRRPVNLPFGPVQVVLRLQAVALTDDGEQHQTDHGDFHHTCAEAAALQE